MQTMAKMVEAIEKLTSASTGAGRWCSKYRSKSRDNRYHSKSRDRSSKKEDPPICFYHRRFGRKSRKCKVRYTLFANNSEIGAKRWKNDIRRIVYKRHSPCFTNRFFNVRCTQDLHRGSGLADEHKVFFVKKKIVCSAKIDGEQRTVYSNTFVLFSLTIFYSAKK